MVASPLQLWYNMPESDISVQGENEMEANFKDALKALNEYAPVPWNLIPDLGLYMDQVITFITHMYAPLYGDATEGYLSSSMINNYVKSKLIPRPVGKKYNREQIAMLTMIVALKQVASMEDIRIMLTPADGMSIERMYTLFCERQKSAIAALLEDDENQNSDLPPAMNFAIVSSGYRAGFEAMLKVNPNES